VIVLLLAVSALTLAAAEDEAVTCRDWLNLPGDQRPAVLAAALESRYGPPAGSPLAACLRALSGELSRRLYDMCLQGDVRYPEALDRVLAPAVEYCAARSG
jgi:hypothetical protein